MGGDPNRQTGDLYGSPYGGDRVGPNPQMQVVLPQVGHFLAPPPDRRSSQDVSYDEDLDMKMKARVINDLLRRIIDPKKLEGLPQYNPKNPLPTNEFNPYA